MSCPRLPRQPFHAATLDAALDTEARHFFGEPRNVSVDPARRVARLSAILDFYPGDFLAKSPSLIGYANRYREAPIPGDYAVEFIPYDWTVSGQDAPSNATRGLGLASCRTGGALARFDSFHCWFAFAARLLGDCKPPYPQ